MQQGRLRQTPLGHFTLWLDSESLGAILPFAPLRSFASLHEILLFGSLRAFLFFMPLCYVARIQTLMAPFGRPRGDCIAFNPIQSYPGSRGRQPLFPNEHAAWHRHFSHAFSLCLLKRIILMLSSYNFCPVPIIAVFFFPA